MGTMFEAHGHSCFSSLRFPPREQGLFKPNQVPVKQIQTVTYGRNKCRTSATFVLNLRNSERNTNRKRALFTRSIFRGTFERGWNVLKLKDDPQLKKIQTDFLNQLNAFYQFSRPHTVIGTVVGITSVSLLPLESLADLSPAFLVGLLKALIPSISMNIYVVGLNQLFDVEIDKVNKPNLPLASGEFSMGLGVAIVLTFVMMSFAMGIAFQSPPLFLALLTSFLLGSAYSVEFPFLRWKRNAFLAATCILIVRAIVVQVAFFSHIQKYVLGRQMVFTKPLIFAVGFMCLFSTVIALFKDIPDVDGDRDFGIKSFSVSLGQERVFWLCISMLLMAYGAAVVVGALSPFLPSKIVTVLGHCSLAYFLWRRARSVNLANKASVTSLYMFIWKLFYFEYLLIPFVR